MFQVLYLDSRYMSVSEIANELGVKEGRVKINLRNAKTNHLKPESLLKVVDDLYQFDDKTTVPDEDNIDLENVE